MIQFSKEEKRKRLLKRAIDIEECYCGILILADIIESGEVNMVTSSINLSSKKAAALLYKAAEGFMKEEDEPLKESQVQ